MTDAIKTLLLGADNVTPATDANPVPVALSGGDVTIGTVKIQGVNGVNIAVVDGLGNLAVAGNGPVQPDTAQTGSILTAGIYNSTPPTLTDGQQAGLQVNNHGALITTATFSGTVDTAAEATASAPSYTEGTSNPLSQTLTGNLRVTDIAAEAVLGTTSGAAVITDATGTIQQYLRGLIKQWIAGTLVLGAGTNAIGKLASNAGVNIGTVSIDSSQLAPPISAYATISSANAQQTSLPTDQVVPNKLQSQSNGTTSSRVVAVSGTPAAVVLKASAGALVEIDVFNVAAYSVFLKVYNATSPTIGSTAPVWTIPIAAGTGYSKSFKYGKWLSTGVSYAITKLQADSDVTAVADGDLTGSIDWI